MEQKIISTKYLINLLKTSYSFFIGVIQNLCRKIQKEFYRESESNLASFQQMTVQQASSYLFDKLIASLLFLLLVTTLISTSITYARYKQRFSNFSKIESLKNETLIINDLISYEASSFLHIARMFKNDVQNIINGKDELINQEKLYEVSLLGKTIGHENLEYKSSLMLLSDKFPKSHWKSEDYKIKYIFDVLYPSIRERMKLHDYANAAYRAQRFINYYYINPSAFTEKNRELMYARKVINNAADNYLYNSKYIITLVDEINWFDDFRFKDEDYKQKITTKLNNYLSSDNPNHKGIITYVIFDIKENTLTPIEKINLWDEYITEYPNNKYTEEAYFNQLITLFSIQLKTLLKDEEEYKILTKKFYNIADKFKTQFKKSYLIDDAMYYAIIFSGLDRNKNIVSYIKTACSKGTDNKITQLRLIDVFKTNNFNFINFIYDAINSPANMTFNEFENHTRLDQKYLKQLKRELYRLEGKYYRESTLTDIIINIASMNLGDISG